MTTSIDPKIKLEGSELKSKVDELIKAGQGFSSCCKATGYVNTTQTGTQIPAASQFSRALLESLGYAFPTGRSGGGGGRSRDYKLNVMGGGNSIISKGYLREAGLNPGDEMKITIDDDGTITLELEPQASSGGGAPVMEITREESRSDADWEGNGQISF